MPKAPITIRTLTPADDPRWRVLFDAYARFYEREPDEAITSHLRARIYDPESPANAIVALDERGYVIGMANYLTHESTTQLAPVCYLQDLFVDPEHRGGGVGEQLIDWLIAEMRSRGWSRLYWSTKETNYRARSLYDKYTLESGFLKYSLDNAARSKEFATAMRAE
ncbi:MAG: GNAT family N-acetyltransferase [Gemmatimonadaceae bacterium]|nr:GNAT family N-acetyltransferase [Gemmatimonadaceae bacterium]